MDAALRRRERREVGVGAVDGAGVGSVSCEIAVSSIWIRCEVSRIQRIWYRCRATRASRWEREGGMMALRWGGGRVVDA